jgi:hypothetical protein
MRMLIEWYADTECPTCDEIFEMWWQARGHYAWAYCPNCYHYLETDNRDDGE